MKLVSITKSTIATKKYTATFNIDNKLKKVHFGASGYMDFIQYQHDPVLANTKKNAYLKRHIKNESWTNPTTPGALSRWILWNKPTLRESVNDFIKRFHL